MTAQSQPPFSRSNPAPRRNSSLVTAAFGCVFAITAMTGCKTRPPIGLSPAKNFSQKKFEGIWHEIYRTNEKEEFGLTQVTTEFRRAQDGKWFVSTRAWKNSEGRFVGSQKVIKGPKQSSPSTFSIDRKHRRHFVIMDDDNSLAVVCGKNYRQFWVLSKNPNPDQAKLDAILQSAEEAGFPVREAICVPTR